MGSKKKRRRQAVVIIHGIGEQRPMTTLRGFVTSLLNYEKDNNKDKSEKRTFWTKPDRVSNSFEMRKISAKGRGNIRSTTHFYEYHWAANMRDTKWRHILKWFWDLMFRNPFDTPSYRLRFLWAFLWFVLISWSIVTFFFLRNFLMGVPSPLSMLGVYEKVFLFLPFILFLLHNIFIGFIGDAARYLRVNVENIHQREIIRKNGVELLKALHKTGDYDRIVVVGHSLGSVIAYDIVSYLWIDFNKAINLNQQEACVESADNNWSCSFGGVKYTSDELQEITRWSRRENKDRYSKEEIEKFQKAQSELWKKIQYERKSWLISDLITIGSPLTHAKLLMADSLKDFYLRIDEREYPISPPLLDGDDLTYPSGSGNLYLHHATPFAVTRWSNIYYKGDFIGGRLAENFGPGIKDYQTNYSGGNFTKAISKLSPVSHIRYWINDYENNSILDKKEFEAIETLYNSMRLNDLEHGMYPEEETS